MRLLISLLLAICLQLGKSKDGKSQEEYWAKGVGFGHNNRPGKRKF